MAQNCQDNFIRKGTKLITSIKKECLSEVELPAGWFTNHEIHTYSL